MEYCLHMEDTTYDDDLRSAMDSFKADTIMPSVTYGAAAAQDWVFAIQDVIPIFVCDLDVEQTAAALTAAAAKHLK